jgi:hypothetical protein
MAKTSILSKIVNINGINVPVICTNRMGRWSWIFSQVTQEKTLVPVRFESLFKAEIKVSEIEMNGIKAWKRMPILQESYITIEIKIPEENNPQELPAFPTK